MITDRTPELATALILGVPAAVHAVIAEVTGTEAPDWIGSVTQISAFGLVAWIVYYMFTQWLPDIQAAHAKQLDAQREAHTAAMQTIAEAHSTAVAGMTEAFKDSLQSQRADLLAIRAVCRAPGSTEKT